MKELLVLLVAIALGVVAYFVYPNRTASGFQAGSSVESAAADQSTPTLTDASATALPGEAESARRTVPAPPLHTGPFEPGAEGDRNVTGVVLDSMGDVIPGAVVTLHPLLSTAEAGKAVDQQLTSLSGAFAFSTSGNLRACLVLVRHDRYAPNWEWWISGAGPLQVVLGESIGIHGAVLFADTQEPLTGGTIDIANREGLIIATVPVGQGGRFQAKGCGGEVLRLGYTHEQLGIRSWHWQTMPTSGDCTVDILVPRGMELRGRVVDASIGNAIEGASIYSSYQESLLTVTSADGTFAAKHWDYTAVSFVVARSPGFGASVVQLEPRSAGHGPAVVEVLLHRGVSVRGTVLGTESGGTTTAEVRIREQFLCGDHWFTNESSFLATLGQEFQSDAIFGLGEISVLCRAKGMGSFEYVVAPNSNRGSAIDVGVIRLGGAHSVRGIVHNHGDTPVGELTVVALRSRPSGVAWHNDEQLRAAVASGGAYSIGGLGTGHWRMRLVDRSGNRLAEEPIMLDASGEAAQLDFHIEASTFEISVVDGDGQAVPGVVIALEGVSHGARAQASAVSDWYGIASVADVRAGCYKVITKELFDSRGVPYIGGASELCFHRDSRSRVIVKRGVRVIFEVMSLDGLPVYLASVVVRNREGERIAVGLCVANGIGSVVVGQDSEYFVEIVRPRRFAPPGTALMQRYDVGTFRTTSNSEQMEHWAIDIEDA